MSRVALAVAAFFAYFTGAVAEEIGLRKTNLFEARTGGYHTYYCLYECDGVNGSMWDTRYVTLARFSLAWLSGGKDRIGIQTPRLPLSGLLRASEADGRRSMLSPRNAAIRSVPTT
jgi:hypothetical protein